MGGSSAASIAVRAAVVVGVIITWVATVPQVSWRVIIPGRPAVAAFVAAHDGTPTVRERAAAAAAGWGTIPEQAERSVVPVLARLMREGYFEIA
jgi:hypothetical protein